MFGISFGDSEETDDEEASHGEKNGKGVKDDEEEMYESSSEEGDDDKNERKKYDSSSSSEDEAFKEGDKVMGKIGSTWYDGVIMGELKGAYCLSCSLLCIIVQYLTFQSLLRQ